MKGPQSLNMIVRKRETERIERENHAFAKRLFDKQAVLNKKILHEEYHNHIKYKKQIAKMTPFPKQRLIVTSDMRKSHPGGSVDKLEELKPQAKTYQASSTDAVDVVKEEPIQTDQ